jgi:hypothetical protein
LWTSFLNHFFWPKIAQKRQKKSYTSDAHKDFSNKKDVVNEDNDEENDADAQQ